MNGRGERLCACSAQMIPHRPMKGICPEATTMFRKIASLGAALLLALTFSAATPKSAAAITCNDEPPYAAWYTEGSGGGNTLIQCFGSTISSLTATMNDHISSVQVFGPNTTGKVPCGFQNTFYSGHYVKLTTGQHGFTIFQWPYTVWTDNGQHADDQISSIKWCNA